MKFDREFAKALCEQLGIEWDSQASVPALCGVPIPEEDFVRLFTFSGTDIYMDSRDALKCA